MRINLLEETLGFLKSLDYREEDIVFVLSKDLEYFLKWSKFKVLSNKYYDNIVYDLKYVSIADDLLILLKDGNFLKRSTRDEGDVSVECWELVNFLDYGEEISGIFSSLVSSKSIDKPDFDFKQNILEDSFDNSLGEEGLSIQEIKNKEDGSVKEVKIFLNKLKSISDYNSHLNKMRKRSYDYGINRVKKKKKLII